VCGLFGNAVGHVYWKEQRLPDCYLLFSARKPRRADDARTP
jgi:hypothetical protein